MSKTKWNIDSTHSEIGFRVKHLMITNVSGSFADYQVEVLTSGEDFSTAQIQVRIKTASVNTNNSQRDEHLRNSDFFEVEKFPEIEFNSESVEKTTDEQFKLVGNLTLKGVTKPVKFDVEYSGTTIDPWGNRRAGFVVDGKIKRTDFGLSFNTILDSGGLALAEEVKVHCEIQLVREKAVVEIK